jgi:hypothetical protein
MVAVMSHFDNVFTERASSLVFARTHTHPLARALSFGRVVAFRAFIVVLFLAIRQVWFLVVAWSGKHFHLSFVV